MSAPSHPSAPTHQYNGQAFARPQNSTPTWNGAQTQGAVQPPNSDGTNFAEQSGVSNADSKDAIREGKQRAKSVMESVAISSNSPINAGPAVAQANGTPQLSRKRSRDGSLIPMNHALATATSSNEAHPAHDEVLLDRYIQRDSLHGAAMNDQSQRWKDITMAKEREKEFYLQEGRQKRLADPGSIFGYGYAGFGNGRTEQSRPEIMYTRDRKPPKGRRNRELRLPRQDASRQAEQHEELVPIRIDLEMDKLRLRDTFTWNLHEKLVSPDMFADYLVEDLRLPPEATPQVMQQVRSELHEQIHNFYPHIIVEDGPLEVGRLYSDHKDDEMRIMIKLNITIGRITLVDQFEWDINNPHNSPEEFARLMAWENALSGEFTTAIAHSIREQSQLYTKSLYLTNHCFDGRPVEDPELRDSFLTAPIHSAFRTMNTQKDWTPYMYEMSEAEMERTELSMMREQRAQKRQLNRRGGPALPDLKDRQRTVRSLIVHTVIPGAVETFETTGIPKIRRSAGRSRRAGGRGDGDIDSDDLDSDDSGADSPAPSAVASGTARTRGMRGAATAAQAAMRANYGGRSATPDLATLATPDTRSSLRRTVLREESVPESDTLIVKLRVPKLRFRKWVEEQEAKKRASEYPLSGYASAPMSTLTAPAAPPQPSRSRNIPATPASQSQALPSQTTPQPPTANGHRSTTPQQPATAAPVQYDISGNTKIDHWPYPDEALVSCLDCVERRPLVLTSIFL